MTRVTDERQEGKRVLEPQPVAATPRLRSDQTLSRDLDDCSRSEGIRHSNNGVRLLHLRQSWTVHHGRFREFLEILEEQGGVVRKKTSRVTQVVSESCQESRKTLMV